MILFMFTAPNAFAQTNSPPTIFPSDPEEGEIYHDDQNIQFWAFASDPEDGNIMHLIEWSSNIDGFLFTGTIFESKLSAGDHTITMQVTDSGGLTTTETLFITVLSFSGNTPPTLEIISPEPASEFIHGDSVTFVGSSFDEEDGNLSNSILWVSNIDGFLHTGSSFTTTSLSIGSHVITTNVIDVLGFFNTKAILVTILDPNNLPENDPPTLLVNTPSHASVFDEGDPVLLTGTALDLQDGVLNSSIEWSDDIDGFLGIGESLTTTSLSAGDHTVTASVTDSGGLTIAKTDIT